MKKKHLERCFLQYRPQLLRYACRLTGNEWDAQDLVQEAFCRALGTEHVFRGEGNLRGWLFRIIRNLYFNQLRARVRITFLDPVRANEQDDSCLVDERFRPDCDHNLRPGRRLVLQALARIPRQFRTPLLLREMEGLPYTDIATVEQTNLGTVRSRLNRGRQRLRQELCLMVREAGYRDNELVGKIS